MARRRAQRTALPGSAHAPLDARSVRGRLARERLLDVSLHLRAPQARRLPGLLGQPRRGPGAWLSRDELRALRAADPRHASLIGRVARGLGLQVLDFSVGRRSAWLRGPAAALEAAFGVELVRHEHHGRLCHGHDGPVHVPAAWAELVDGVFGLQSRPAARPHVRHHRRAPGVRQAPDVAHYTADQLAALYDFPAGYDGRGRSIGLIELGGGFRHADLQAYFRRLRLPVPQVVVKRVNGARNRPLGRPWSADSEVLLDLEVAGGAAPGARLVVYFAPNDDRGFIDALKAAVHDREHDLSVLSISWGRPEDEWSPSARDAFNEVLHEAALLGVTVLASAGDQGASAGRSSGLAVEFPASSPYVLACGGTRLRATRARIRDESVWNDLSRGFGATGGGVSAVFARPGYQRAARVPAGPRRRTGRGVPDVAADADPETGHLVRVDGRWLRLGGTSAVAPLWAGLVARLGQALDARLGLLGPTLYRLRRARALRAVLRGDNGGYSARPGWSACTGLGTPRGTTLLRALRRLGTRALD